MLKQHSEAYRTRAMVMTALLAALSCAATMAIRIPSPTGGYMNLGDTVVLLGAYLLGGAYGAAAGAIGPALADLFSGYMTYVPATLVIKALMAMIAAGIYSACGRRGWSLVLAGCAAELWMVAGYWLYDGFLVHSLAGSLAGVPSNLVQAAFGVAGSWALTLALRRAKPVRERFPRL